MIRKNRFISAMTAMLVTFAAWAEIPAGYYSSCEGKTGQALLKALAAKISNHTNVGYDGLWDVYKKSDVRSDGTLWDIYSTKRWPSNFTRCGNYSVVGDCVNREHSLPKSWWGGGKATQYSDAYHLYPTDGKVNGQRSNYPFGECSAGTSLAASGSVKPLGKLGPCSFSGYSGTVFEPDDEYKGDLARSYFYMATCYNSIISGWTQGNGNQFFAGNSYPVFKTWAVNLLLKWSRQDEVSQKEIDRNEAVASYQKNRNPFIDYPELVEYIWGDKVGQAWYPGGSKDPSFEQPVQNSTINLGKAAVGIARSTTVTVKGSNLTQNVTVSATGGFKVTPATVTATQANSGTQLTVSILSESAGDAEGTLTLRSGDLERSVDIIAEIVDGLPMFTSDITTEGFTLNWINLHQSAPATTYSLSVAQNGQQLAGYPRTVKAFDEKYTVTGLDPATEYTVTFTSVPGNINVPVLTVTTAEPVPSIQVLFDGDLHFDALPGETSDIAELLLEIENIDSEIKVAVESPFEVSTDKTSWAQTTVLQPDEDRFYMRLAATAIGKYETAIRLTAGKYFTDDASATATVADKVNFLEDWEEAETDLIPCYSSTEFNGTICRWSVNDGGFGTTSQDKNFNGTTVLRMGKSPTSSIAMSQDKTGGIGTVSFDAAKWPSDKDAAAKINLEYSADGGATWSVIGNFEIEAATAATYTATVNKAGNGRIRLVQTSGQRWFVDNIAITDYSSMSAVNQLDYHSWDAYCLNSQLVIESRDADVTISVYAIDGRTCFSGHVPSQTAVRLPAGLYIVTDGSFARRVLVK